MRPRLHRRPFARMPTAPLSPSRLSRFLLNPWFAGGTTIAGVVAGWLGAHFDEDIAHAHFPLGWPGNTFSIGATIFWLVTGLFAVCYASTLKEQARVADRTSEALDAVAHTATEMSSHVGDIEGKTHTLVSVAGEIDHKTVALQSQTANLERLVQRLHTLPPIGFLQEYAASGRLLVEMTHRADPTLDPEALESLLRAQLVCVLKIVTVFDEGGANARYGCNLLLHRNPAALGPTERVELQARLRRFVEAGVEVSGLAGVLEARPALSVSSDSNAQPDPRLAPMALPVPHLDANVDPLEGPVLPGAPYTFLSGEASAFEVATDLERLSEDGRFTRFLVDRLRAFFAAPDSAIRSFACFPIYAPGIQEARPIAVLSVHRDTENPSAAERLALLNPMMVPLCAGLGMVLQTLQDRGARLSPKDSS